MHAPFSWPIPLTIPVNIAYIESHAINTQKNTKTLSISSYTWGSLVNTPANAFLKLYNNPYVMTTNINVIVTLDLLNFLAEEKSPPPIELPMKVVEAIDTPYAN